MTDETAQFIMTIRDVFTHSRRVPVTSHGTDCASVDCDCSIRGENCDHYLKPPT